MSEGDAPITLMAVTCVPLVAFRRRVLNLGVRMASRMHKGAPVLQRRLSYTVRLVAGHLVLMKSLR